MGSAQTGLKLTRWSLARSRQRAPWLTVPTVPTARTADHESSNHPRRPLPRRHRPHLHHNHHHHRLRRPHRRPHRLRPRRRRPRLRCLRRCFRRPRVVRVRAARAAASQSRPCCPVSSPSIWDATAPAAAKSNSRRPPRQLRHRRQPCPRPAPAPVRAACKPAMTSGHCSPVSSLRT